MRENKHKRKMYFLTKIRISGGGSGTFLVNNERGRYGKGKMWGERKSNMVESMDGGRNGGRDKWSKVTWDKWR